MAGGGASQPQHTFLWEGKGEKSCRSFLYREHIWGATSRCSPYMRGAAECNAAKRRACPALLPVGCPFLLSSPLHALSQPLLNIALQIQT